MPIPATRGGTQIGIPVAPLASVGRALALGPGVAAAVGAGAPDAATGGGVTTAPPIGGPAQADGTGPAGAGCGPYLVGALALTSLNQASPKAVISRPSAAVNASSSVRPSAYERMSVTRASLP